MLSVGSEKDPVLGFCKHGDKQLNFVKARIFFNQIEYYQFVITDPSQRVHNNSELFPLLKWTSF
jgi:hypothetical protein